METLNLYWCSAILFWLLIYLYSEVCGVSYDGKTRGVVRFVAVYVMSSPWLCSRKGVEYEMKKKKK
jgi:hypothetical protein